MGTRANGNVLVVRGEVRHTWNWPAISDEKYIQSALVIVAMTVPKDLLINVKLSLVGGTCRGLHYVTSHTINCS